MAGRPKLPDHLLSRPRANPKRKNNTRPTDPAGEQRNEPKVVKSFWREYSVSQIQQMTDEEIMEAIDRNLEAFIARQLKQNKRWDFPIYKDMLDIAFYKK